MRRWVEHRTDALPKPYRRGRRAARLSTEPGQSHGRAVLGGGVPDEQADGRLKRPGFHIGSVTRKPRLLGLAVEHLLMRPVSTTKKLRIRTKTGRGYKPLDDSSRPALSGALAARWASSGRSADTPSTPHALRTREGCPPGRAAPLALQSGSRRRTPCGRWRD
jgi:hypothetical protein